MTDVLYIPALLVFFSVMLGFVFSCGRRTDSPEFDASGLSAKSDDHEALRSVTG